MVLQTFRSFVLAAVFLCGVTTVESFDCKGQTGFFSDPQNCANFYRCVVGTAHLFNCPTGLYFNPTENVCDWPRNVQCSAGSTRPILQPSTGSATPRRTTSNTNLGASRPAGSLGTSQPTSLGTSRPTTLKPSMAPSHGGAPTTLVGGSGKCPRRVCYYTNWAQYRPGGARFVPENVNPDLCTHIIYAFAKLNGNNLAPFEWNDDTQDGMYKRINALKQKNPSLKTLLAVGGWNMGSAPFTSMVATAENRRQFATQSITFLQQRGFDGLDLDWEYPANRGSPAGDKENFSSLVKELREMYSNEATKSGKPALLLTAAVAAGESTVDTAYDIPEVSKHLDFINLMTYDLHGSWEPQTGHNSPLYARNNETTDHLNVDWAARYWVSKGCPKDKLVIGIPVYGRTFSLSSTLDASVGAPASGPGTAGQFTREAGYISYYEVCRLTGTEDGWISEQRVPYKVQRQAQPYQWIGYENIRSVTEKATYVRNNGYGGVMVWAIDLDDFSGDFCGQGAYPLWTAVNNVCQRDN